MEIPKKYREKIVLKNQVHLNENWVEAGGRRGDRLLLLLLRIISAFFPRAHSRAERHFYFFFVFLFSGNWRAVPPPPHMNTSKRTG